jgi:hypothetical protein
VSAAGNHIPVFKSPKFAIEGKSAVPSPNEATPLTESRASGAVVPIPTLPVDVILMRSALLFADEVLNVIIPSSLFIVSEPALNKISATVVPFHFDVKLRIPADAVVLLASLIIELLVFPVVFIVIP